MLQKLARDVLFLIIDNLDGAHQKKFCRLSKKLFRSYKLYVKSRKFLKGGQTLLYPHQKKIIDWSLENLSTKNSLLLSAYMSAGKTLCALEIARRFTVESKTLCVILVPATVIQAWIKERDLHYPGKLGKHILFDHSFCASNRKKLDLIIKDLTKDQKVLDSHLTIISTPRAINDKWFDRASLFIFDESHRMTKAYKKVYNFHIKSKKIFMSGTGTDVKGIYLDDSLEILAEGSSFPKMSSRTIFTSDPYNIIAEDMAEKKDKNICIITPKGDDSSDAMKPKYGRKIYSFFQRQRTFEKAYDKSGGILITSIKAVSEGNNLNTTSLVYIVNPSKATAQTIQQCICRFYRESNRNSKIEIVFILENFDNNIWCRCRIALTMLKNIDSKSVQRVLNINKYLISNGVELEKLKDNEIVLIYGLTEGEFNPLEVSAESSIPMNVMVRAMMF